MEITQDYLIGKFFVVDGVLHRRLSNGKVRTMDSYDDLGYVRLKVLGKVVYAHRIVFLMTHGFLPVYVDHIDGDPMNNDPSNLRAATPTENNCNRRIGYDNESGFKGIHFDKRSGRWVSSVRKSGLLVRKFFYDIDEAKQHNKAIRLELHGDFARYA